MNLNYLVIEGNIGAGKTSLVKMISRDFGARMLLEGFAGNPFLPKFYTDQEKYAFPLEMSFLADRYTQLSRNVAEFDLFSSFLVSDYYFTKSLIFAQNTLADDEFRLYRNFFNIIYDKIPKPDLYVYLHVSTENLLGNIRKRGRTYEQHISRQYLEKIRDGYFQFFKCPTDFPILLIDINGLNFIDNNEHYQAIIGQIFGKEYKTGLYRALMS